jgi:hypothetical protein
MFPLEAETPRSPLTPLCSVNSRAFRAADPSPRPLTRETRKSSIDQIKRSQPRSPYPKSSLPAPPDPVSQKKKDQVANINKMSAPAEQRGGFGRGAARGGDRGRGGAYRMRLEEGRNGTGEQVYRSRQQRRRTGPNTSWIRTIWKDGMLDTRERSISQDGRRRIRWRPRRNQNRQGRRPHAVRLVDMLPSGRIRFRRHIRKGRPHHDLVNT